MSYSDVFALDSSELGTTDVVAHSIVTRDHRPSRQPVKRTPFALREKVDTLVREMLEQKVIEPSESPWASPIVLLQKKNGGVRFCVDYRKLNGLTKLDEFPLPRIDDTLDLLSGARYFTTLDLASGYWQVAMEESSKEKTAFTTYSGLYQFKKMPFGLVNAPATFQRLMEVVLSGLARTVYLVYLDDILVIGKTLEEHNVNLARVLERMRSAGLRFQPKKCHFAREELGYLGYVVSAEGGERNYGITKLEGLGVVWAVRHFRPYLYGHPCDVYTDHSALTLLLNTLQPSGKLARLGMAIQEMDIRIHHRTGRSNANADALSRSPLADQRSPPAEETQGVVAVVEPEDLSALQHQDKELAAIICYVTPRRREAGQDLGPDPVPAHSPRPDTVPGGTRQHPPSHPSRRKAGATVSGGT